MDYICLAAGKGTRFGHLGRYLQKCMYPVGLRPFLEYSLANLRQSAGLDVSADRLTIIVGHHGEQVRAYFGAAYRGLRLGYLEQRELLGTGHALRLAHDALAPRESVVAWLADTYVPVELFERLRACPAPNAQTVAPGPPGEKPDLRVSVAEGRVRKAWQGEGELYDIGLWKLSPAVLSGMTETRHGEYRMMPNLQLALERGHEVAAIHADEWLHLGGVHPTPEANALAVARRVLELEGAA
jgi:NDP-sugar pyrophosphorylase family protein